MQIQEDKSSKVAVRRIKTKDFPRLAKILNVAFQREIALVGLDTSRLMRLKKYHSIIEMLYYIFDLLHKDYPTILVAAMGDEVVGEVHLVPFGKRVWTIDSLAVDPTCGRRGVGFTLIKESVDYLAKRQARKVLSSMRTDNIPANKIAQELGYTIFEERVILINELGKLQKSNSDDILVRKAKSEDTRKIYGIAKTVDSAKTQAFETTQADFSDSLSQMIMNRITGTHTRKLVAEHGGKIVGYAQIVYTSPKEAARIEPFYLSHSSNISEVARSLFNKATYHLAERKVNRTITSVSKERRETLDSLIQLGFTPIANMYWYICLDQN